MPDETTQAPRPSQSGARQPGTGDASRVGLASLGQLLDLPLNHLARVPIEVANLLCATGLPDTHKLDIAACLATLDEMTQAVLHETRRHAYRFHQNPAEFEGKEGVYRMIVLITVVQEDFNVRYDAEAVARKTYEKSGEGFLHSLLDPKKSERNGTCANMPVLYAAIARRLGYPVYLVCAKGHMFCRWHDSQTGERFNIEGSGRGFATFDDKHYMGFPHEIKPIDVHSGLFLKDMTPPEEIANFLTTRGHVLYDRDHVLDATVAYAQAHRLDPTNPHHMQWLMASINKEMDLREQKKLPGTWREGEEREHFNADGTLPIRRYVLNNRMHRVAGIQPLHLNGEATHSLNLTSTSGGAEQPVH